MFMGEHTIVNDKWMGVISSQGSSLLSAYTSSTKVISSQGSSLLSAYTSSTKVTNFGLSHIRNCSNLQSLGFDCCGKISARGIKHIGGSHLTLTLGHIIVELLPLLSKPLYFLQFLSFWVLYSCTPSEMLH